MNTARRHWRIRRDDGTLTPCTEVTPEEWDRLGDHQREIIYLGKDRGIAFARLDRS
jgi:hypothetical protein